MNNEVDRLQPALESYHIEMLKLIADTLGVEQLKPARKQKLVSDLCQTIPALAASTEFIRALSAVERELLKQMVKLNRVCDHRDIALPLIKQGMVSVKGLASTKAQPSLDAVLLSLLSKGLVMNSTQLVHSSDRRQFEPLLNFSIPPDVRVKLAKVLLPVEDVHSSSKLIEAPTPAYVQNGNLEEFLRQLFFTWSELRRKPARLLKTGDIGKRDQRRMTDGLGLSEEKDAPRFRLLYAMLKALNLVEIRDGMAAATDTHAVTLFWNATPAGQMREFVNAYPLLALPVTYNIYPLSDYSYYGSLQTQPDSEIRKAILTVLPQLSSASWVPYPLFYAFATSGASGYLALSPPTLQLLLNNMRWYGLNRTEELHSQFDVVEKEIVNSVLEEMLMLGFVDVGYKQPQNSPPEAMRISELMYAHLTQQPWSKPQVQGQVVLQPDFQLLAIGPVPLRVLANLERVAVREKQDQSVIAYRITREGIYQAFQHGESLAEIEGYLEDATGQSLPQNIARTLEEWTDQNQRIVVRRDIQVLQTASSEVLDRLMEDPVVKRHLHPLDEKTAWIRMNDSALVEKRLRTLEILPSHSHDHTGDLINSLRWDGDCLVSRSPLPSLYVIGTMQLIAEAVKADTSVFSWKFTPDSIRDAVTSGWKLSDIIKTIETMTGGPLSLDWEKQLKAWGKYYGDGTTAQVRLIRLSSKQALNELRSKDRNLSRWLKLLPNAEALAIVNETHWEETRALLAAYGILVKEEAWW